MSNTSKDSNKRLTHQREGNARPAPARARITLNAPNPKASGTCLLLVRFWRILLLDQEHEENKRRLCSARRVWHFILLMCFQCWLKQTSEGKREVSKNRETHARHGEGAKERHCPIACVSCSTHALCFFRPKPFCRQGVVWLYSDWPALKSALPSL